MDEREYNNVYAIPANYTDSGKLLGGMIDTRNAIETVILVLALGYPELILIPMPGTIRIVVMTVTLLPLAVVLTPNIPEAEVLSGRAIASSEDVEAAASLIADRCVAVWENASDFADMAPSVPAILIKGGHGVGEPDAADDYLRMADGESVWLRGARIANDNTHGTGCSLSSAIACGLARGFSVDVAVRDAKAYVAGALAAGLNLGRGSGPLDHMWQYGAPMPC